MGYRNLLNQRMTRKFRYSDSAVDESEIGWPTDGFRNQLKRLQLRGIAQSKSMADRQPRTVGFTGTAAANRTLRRG